MKLNGFFASHGVFTLEDLDDYDLKVIQEWQRHDPEIKAAPFLMERYNWLRAHNYPHFRIIQLVGGRRSGKGHVTGIALAYKVFKTQQIENPAFTFGIERGKNIYFSVVAAALDQAVDHQFGDVSNMIMNCKYLVDNNLLGKSIQSELSVYTPYDVRRKMALAQSGMRVDKDLASLRVKAHGTNSKTIRGSATLGFVFDEMAHLVGGESRMSDEEVWKAIMPSLNQFGDQALIFANSSPYHKQGQFFKLYEQILQTEKLDPESVPFDSWPYKDHVMLQFPSWAMYKDWELDEYWNMIGPEVESPENSDITREEELRDPETFKVEYRAQFAEVTDAFLRTEIVERMFDPKNSIKILGHPLEPMTGAFAYSRYKAHGDPAATGANFGIAVGHVEQITHPETGVTEDHVVFDLIDAFYPKEFDNDTIDWLQVVPTITSLINNFRPYEWTFDQFDNRMAIQQLIENCNKLGIMETMIYQKPANRTLNASRAKNFRAAINLNRVHAPHPSSWNYKSRKNSIELAQMELTFLQEKPVGSGIVDKPTIGPIQTKDIADCIMEVTDALIGDSISQLYDHVNVGAQFGSPGGYGIGQVPRLGNTDNFEELSHWYPTTGRNPRARSPYMPERGRNYGRNNR